MQKEIIVLILMVISAIILILRTRLNPYVSGKVTRLIEAGNNDIKSYSNLEPQLLIIALDAAYIIINVPIILFIASIVAKYRSANAFIITCITASAAFILMNILATGIVDRKGSKCLGKREIRVLNIPYTILYPLTSPLRGLLSIISGRDYYSPRNGTISDEEEELKAFIDAGEQSGLLEKEEGELLHSVVEFSDILVKEVMVPRTEIVCIDESAGFEILRKLFMESGHSRIPVYRDRVDNMIGIVHAKDLLARWDDPAATKLGLSAIVRQPYFIPETKKVKELLREFQREKIHMALVVDEYGGIEGVVTFEDLLEELVGEIQDEYDNEIPELIEKLDGVILVDGSINIEEIEKHFQIRFEDGDYETIGGFIFQEIGRVPVQGEEIIYNNLRIKVKESDGRRIKKVEIQIQNQSGLDQDAGLIQSDPRI